MLRVYVGIVLLFLTIITFTFLGIEQYQYYQKQKEVKEQLDKAIKEPAPLASPPPLPVCSKGEKHIHCRQLTADQTGATVRGARDDSKDD
jgi:hypothetical protein